ncbi:MAG: nicotinamide mononucleotide transporter [Planctomycetaceae bacterium]
MTWLVAALSLAGTVLNIRRVRACFLIWAATNTAWAVYDFAHGLPAQGCLMVVYAGLAVWGWIAWATRPTLEPVATRRDA